MDLPEDCWELVLRSLGDERHWHPVSLVCRRFLSITDRLRSHLRISDNESARRFRRFPNLKHITVTNFHGDLDRLFRDIALSGLKIEAISLHCSLRRFPKSETATKLGENLRSLDLRNSHFLENDVVVRIAESFPNLEFLDISRPQGVGQVREVTDAAIEVMSSKLKHLKSIDLSGNSYLTDLSVVSLSNNCPDLTEITVQDCRYIQGEAISSLLRRAKNLSSLSLSTAHSLSTLIVPESLRHLHLSHMYVPPELLSSLERSSIRIEELSLIFCSGMTRPSLVSFLRFHGRSLRRLALAGFDFLSDRMMQFSILPHLGNLNSISLSHFYDIRSSTTFFSILRNCVFVEHVEIKKTCLGEGQSPSIPCIHARLKSLCLKENLQLDDHTIGVMAGSCPNIESLDISFCGRLTSVGLESIGEGCPKITNLCINGCSRIKGLGTKSSFAMLTFLRASKSGINDEALYAISQRCKAIMLLDLDGCSDISEKGVNDVLIGCKMLQERHFSRPSVSTYVLNGVMSSRLLLRKVVPESRNLPPKLQELLIYHGCLMRENKVGMFYSSTYLEFVKRFLK